MLELYSQIRTNNDKFEQLLNALKANKEKLINDLCLELFLTKDGKVDRERIKAFCDYSGATIFSTENDPTGSLIGWIRYNKKIFFYGKETGEPDNDEI